MDIFTRFNRNKIADRQLDTLIGLSKGIAADGNVNQAEAEFLQSWLVQNGQSEHPVILNLLSKVSEALADGVLDEEESRELLTILRTISGESSEIGEVAKTSAYLYAPLHLNWNLRVNPICLRAPAPTATESSAKRLSKHLAA